MLSKEKQKREEELRQAAANGNVALTKHLLRQGTKINAVDGDGNCALHLAALRGHPSVVQALVHKGCSKDTVDTKFGNSAMHLAALNGHDVVVKLLIDARCKHDVREKAGKSPLHFAARLGHTAVVEALLKAGCDKDARSADGCTPLHVAAFRGHAEVVGMLLSYGCNKDLLWKEKTALQHTRCTHVQQKLAALETEESMGSGLIQFARQGDIRMVEFLLDNGAQVNWKDADGKTPCDLAANQEIRKLIQDRGGQTTESIKLNLQAIELEKLKAKEDALKQVLSEEMTALVREAVKKALAEEGPRPRRLIGQLKTLKSGQFVHAAKGIKPLLVLPNSCDVATLCSEAGIEAEVEQLLNCDGCAEVQACFLEQLQRSQEANLTRKLATALQGMRVAREKEEKSTAASRQEAQDERLWWEKTTADIRAKLAASGSWMYGRYKPRFSR